MLEEWKIVHASPSYAVSSLGRVKRIAPYRSTKVGRLLTLYLDKDGYPTVRLSERGKVQFFRVSRLVTTAFHGDPPSPRHIAAHGNGVRSDNRATNLRWATEEENFSDRYRHNTDPTGERNPRAKLTEDDVNLIRWKYALGFERRVRVISFLHQITETTTRNILKGKLWSHLEFQI